MMKKAGLILVVAVGLLLWSPGGVALGQFTYDAGSGYPLMGLHSHGGDTSLDRGWMAYAGVEKAVTDRLSFGVLFNYAEIGMTSRQSVAARHSDLDVHVLSGYAKPYLRLSDDARAFLMVGVGYMHVDGPEYRMKDGPCCTVSAGVDYKIDTGLSIGVSVLHVRGTWESVEDITYTVPVVTVRYTF